MKENIKELVHDEILKCVVNVIKRLQKENQHRPFHSRLLPNEALRWSLFERSFSTSFGQGVIEKISKIIALGVSGTSDAQNQKITHVELSLATVHSIDDHLRKLRENKLGRRPDWELDIASIEKKGGARQGVRIISDLWFCRKGIDYFYSIKTVKPNLDQTAIAKKDLLELKLSLPKSEVYFALPYNPYSEDKMDYGHKMPFKIFDMLQDSCILIGEEYWDKIGGKGTYRELLDIFDTVGRQSKQMISTLKVS